MSKSIFNFDFLNQIEYTSRILKNTMNDMQNNILTKENNHIANLIRFETMILQRTEQIEHEKAQFLAQFNHQATKHAADNLIQHCTTFVQEIDDVRSNALSDVDGVLFEFRTPDGVNHKSMSKLVAKRKKVIENRVADLNRLAIELQQSLSFVTHLQRFDHILHTEQNKLTAMTGKKICPFCNEAVPVPDWLLHANERHATSERMTVPDAEREAFDKNNAKEEFQRSGRRTSPTATSSNGGGGGNFTSTTKGGGGGSGFGMAAPPPQTPNHQHTRAASVAHTHNGNYGHNGNGSTPMGGSNVGSSNNYTAPFNRRRSMT